MAGAENKAYGAVGVTICSHMPLTSKPSPPGQDADSSQANGKDNGPSDSFHHQKDSFRFWKQV